MDLLVTSSRFPFAIEEIRKLGRSGHRVYASDSFATSPGNHSRYVARAFVTAPPRYETARFLDDLEAFLSEHHVDLVLPSFEEVLYIARHRDRFERLAHVFAPSFATLRLLHDKITFVNLARELGLRVPETIVATSKDELELAARSFGEFFARPAFTRGGVSLYTNVGPLAEKSRLDECTPTREHPYVVQPFVHGEDVCTFSVAQEGRVAAHVAYVHPLRLEHAGGIVLESIEGASTLPIVSKIVEATRYHGQISFDFLRTKDGLVLVECNPRPSSGLALMPDEMLHCALFGAPPPNPRIAPAGAHKKLSLALLRNAIIRPGERRASLAALFSRAPDVYVDPHDLSPLFYQFLAYHWVMKYRMERRAVHRSDLMQGYFHDLCWDGDPTPESSRVTSGLRSSSNIER